MVKKEQSSTLLDKEQLKKEQLKKNSFTLYSTTSNGFDIFL
jgi:hypothetical protein